MSVLCRRLVQAYALDATLLQAHAKAGQPVSADQVVQFMAAGREKSRKQSQVAGHNELQVAELEQHKFRCTTQYDGKLVHWQVMQKTGRLAGQGYRHGLVGPDW